eukprot:5738581-Alexandrium_andersonii.AAC.1
MKHGLWGSAGGGLARRCTVVDLLHVCETLPAVNLLEPSGGVADRGVRDVVCVELCVEELGAVPHSTVGSIRTDAETDDGSPVLRRN